LSAIVDFSISQWMKEKGLTAGKAMAGYVVSELLETLGIGEYLLESPCDRSAVPYNPATNGWKTGEVSIYNSC
jgi:hypothetical protein